MAVSYSPNSSAPGALPLGAMGTDPLSAVRALIEQGWSQGAYARDAKGQPVQPVSDAARAWSLLGAFALVARYGIPIKQIAGVLPPVADVIEADSIDEWNEDPVRTQRDILDALDTARREVEKKSRTASPSRQLRVTHPAAAVELL